MDSKTIRKALRGAIDLDLDNAQKNLKFSIEEHARVFKLIAPNLASVLVALGKLDDQEQKAQAEAN